MKKKDRRIKELEEEVRALRERAHANDLATTDTLNQQERDHRREVLEVEKRYEDADEAFRERLVALALGTDGEPNQHPSANVILRMPPAPAGRRGGRVRAGEPALLVEVRGLTVGAIPVVECRMGDVTFDREADLEVTIPQYAVKAVQQGEA